MADWYVYQHDADPVGPWSTEKVADAILAGKLAPDVWVAAPGGPRWLRALDVPVIARLVDGIPTTPRRRDSGLRFMPRVHAAAPESDPAPTTRRSDAPIPAAARPIEDAPATERDLPPASSTQPSTPVRADRRKTR